MTTYAIIYAIRRKEVKNERDRKIIYRTMDLYARSSGFGCGNLFCKEKISAEI